MYVEIPQLFFFYFLYTTRKILLANTSFPVFKYAELFPLPSRLVFIRHRIIVILIVVRKENVIRFENDDLFGHKLSTHCSTFTSNASTSSKCDITIYQSEINGLNGFTVN